MGKIHFDPFFGLEHPKGNAVLGLYLRWRVEKARI